MNLKCKINGKEYNVAQGATFAEEYNETLDSGTIIIPHVKKIKNLMPFDDVFIYDSDSQFKGYGPGIEMPKFYKHLLVDQFSEEIINLDERICTYKIELMSETKKLEVIQLPNISITQPLKKENKKSIYKYLQNFLELYSPLKKVVSDKENKKWEFEKKYSLSPDLESTFSNVYAPDFSLNAPSLKDVIAQLMLVKDRIPYVKDDVIYALDISARKSPFDLNTKYVNYISGSRSSANHADNLKRTYSNALSQDNTCNMVEYTSFRNSDNALLTLENMRLETRYPIYKINKVYMCYYKKISIVNNKTNESEIKTFLCKQDISKLVKLNSERNLLSQDWDDFHTAGVMQYKTIDELAKYKMMTVGYNIGSNYIEGWGTKYTYPSNWFVNGTTNGLKIFDNNATYIQNIFNVMNDFYPLGIYNNGYINEYAGTEEGEYTYISSESNSLSEVLSKNVINVYINDDLNDNPIWPDDLENLDIIGKISKNASIFFKSLFFVIDYNAMYNGTVIHSKDNVFRDDITINDNASASLTLLEKDGLFQKEKANRFGNKGIAINARYTDISQLQKLGSVYENEDDTDVVIYHREYSIWDNMISCSYAGTKNYVLKNYFTSVFARYRTYNLMSYEESTNRAENNKMMILFSKDKSYYEKDNDKFKFNYFSKDYIKQILSFITPTEKTKALNFFKNRGEINAGYIEHTKDGVTSSYLSDVNKFVNGNSLCFNIKMFDNVSGGVYIKTLQPYYNLIKYTEDFVGSVQDWYMMVDSVETGQADELGFYICNFDYKDIYIDKISNDEDEDFKNIIKDKILKLPKIDGWDLAKARNVIGGDYLLYKDNKETIDMTFQIEPICYDKDVVFSPWMMKLSDLLTRHNKFEDGSTRITVDGIISNIEIIQTEIDNGYKTTPMIVISFDKKDFEAYKKIKDIIYKKEIEYQRYGPLYSEDEGKITRYALTFDRIESINDNYVNVYGIEELGKAVTLEGQKYPVETIYRPAPNVLEFRRVYNSDLLNVPDDRVYFSNIILDKIVPPAEGGYRWEYTTFNELSYLEKEDYKFYDFSCGKEYSSSVALYYPYFQENNVIFENSIISKDLDENLIYNQNMYIAYSTDFIKKDIIYEEYELDKLPEDKKISEDKVSDRFTIKKDDLDRNYLKVDLLNIPESTSSVQYWFLNNGSLHFVFGVNITQEDRARGYIKIYLSLLSTRDTRVYDKNNNLIGEVYNYADSNNNKKYGKAQYYYDIIENENKGE